MYEGITGAIILSLISLLMVFIILGLLALLMVGLKVIVQLFSKKVALEKEASISAKEEIEIAKEGKAIFTPKEQEVVSGAKQDKNEELIAVISAAVASYMTKPTTEIKVINIKRNISMPASPWATVGRSSLNSERILVSARKKEDFEIMKQFKIKVNEKEYLVEVEEITTGATFSPAAPVSKVEPKVVKEEPKPEEVKPTKSENKQSPTISTAEGEEIKAPMPGKILKINVSEGDVVKEGDTVLILEAMKMENEIIANSSGKVKKISVSVNDMVETDDTLLIIG